MEQHYYLCTGPGKKEYFTLPAQWTPAYFVENSPGAETPVGEMTLGALATPVGTRPLRDLCSGARNVAVIIDDGTRPTPVSQILDVLLPYLLDAGVSREKITIVVGLGTHVPMEKKALESRVGRDVVAAYPIVQHNARQADLVPVAIPGDDRVLKVNPVVAGADLRIGVSSIQPHRMAGYGGGPKILMPGVSNFDFITDHHMKNTIHLRARAGLVRGNPFHEDCMRAARAIGLDFSINCVYNREAEIAGIVGGSLEASFAAAVGICEDKLGHKFQKKVDVTITSTYPHTHAPQFAKGLYTPNVITREEGAILMVAPIVQPIPDAFIRSLRAIAERYGNDRASVVRDTMSRGMLFLPDQSVEFNMAASSIILRPQIRTILVSAMISPGEASAMGMEHAASVADGLAVLERAYPSAQTAILPSGGLVVPIVDWIQ